MENKGKKKQHTNTTIRETNSREQLVEHPLVSQNTSVSTKNYLHRQDTRVQIRFIRSEFFSLYVNYFTVRQRVPHTKCFHLNSTLYNMQLVFFALVSSAPTA